MTLQFRVRGAAIQVVRSTIDAETKRAKAEPLGVLPQSGAQVPEALVAKLSGEEKADLTAYADGLKRNQALRLQLAARTLNLTAADAAQYLATLDDPKEVAAVSDVLQEAIQTLRGALRRAGGTAETGARGS